MTLILDCAGDEIKVDDYIVFTEPLGNGAVLAYGLVYYVKQDGEKNRYYMQAARVYANEDITWRYAENRGWNRVDTIANNVRIIPGHLLSPNVIKKLEEKRDEILHK